MSSPCILLVDNGSRRAAATLALRGLAAAVSERCGRRVSPVSLQHADRIAAADLGGRPAEVFRGFVDARLREGERDFVVLPLFFGPSRALSSFIPQQVAELTDIHGEFRVSIADVLVPLPGGEPRLAEILADNVRSALGDADAAGRVIVVDHGSPIPQVTAVRKYAAESLSALMPDSVDIGQAVMERRDGAEYDFNGDLLESVLAGIDPSDRQAPVVLAMLFLLPGRHAGEGGDIAEICDAAMQRQPGLRVAVSCLVAEHPRLIDILSDRLEACLATR